MDEIVHRKLGEARWRLTIQHFLHQGGWALVAGFSLFVVLRFLSGFSPFFRALPPAVWVAVLAGPLVAAVIAAFYRWRDPGVVAREIDALAPTRDRFVTALKLDRETAASFAEAVQKEVADFVSRFPLKDHLRLKIPVRKLLWLLVPLAGLGAIEGFRHWRCARLAPELAGARHLVEKARIAADRRAEKDPELAMVARELEVALVRLPDSPDPLREVLRSLAELEQKMSAPAGAEAALSADETSALAEALAGEKPLLASALRSGDTQAAAAGVLQLDTAELARALEEAARHVEISRLRELSRQGGMQAQKRLVTMLQSAGGSSEGSERRKFLSDLSDIKNGMAGMEKAAEGGGEGPSPDGSEKSAPARTGDAPPGGAPGSEKDFGRGADLVGEGELGKSGPGVEEFVQGAAGEGSTHVEIFRAAGGDDPRAAQAYRSAYQTALPAALDAVNREEIPAGSRLLVRRYFEAIRPKE